MTDYAQLTSAIVEGFERGEFDAMVERHGNEDRRARGAGGLAAWWPNLDKMTGRSRRVTASMQVTHAPPTARAVLTGDEGEAVVTLLFDDAGKFTHLGVTDWPLILGIRNLQIDCPNGTVPQVAELYAELLAMRVPADHGPNWVVLAGDKRTKPALPLAGQAEGWRAPAWGDPDRPQQVHVEVLARDVSEAAAIVQRHRAIAVDDDVWADQGGHAIRLVHGESGDAPGAIGRIVLDCFSPRALASFYEELLDMRARPEDTPERVVIARAADSRCSRSDMCLSTRHRDGPTPSIPSRCTWTSRSRTPSPRSVQPSGSVRFGSRLRHLGLTRMCSPTRQDTRSAWASPDSDRGQATTNPRDARGHRRTR